MFGFKVKCHLVIQLLNCKLYKPKGIKQFK